MFCPHYHSLAKRKPQIKYTSTDYWVSTPKLKKIRPQIMVRLQMRSLCYKLKDTTPYAYAYLRISLLYLEQETCQTSQSITVNVKERR